MAIFFTTWKEVAYKVVKSYAISNVVITQVHSLSQNSEITQGFSLFPVLALNPGFLLLPNTLTS